jgi:hypothetical protein
VLALVAGALPQGGVCERSITEQVTRALARERTRVDAWSVRCWTDEVTLQLRSGERQVVVSLKVQQVERWNGQALLSLALARLSADRPDSGSAGERSAERVLSSTGETGTRDAGADPRVVSGASRTAPRTGADRWRDPFGTNNSAASSGPEGLHDPFDASKASSRSGGAGGGDLRDPFSANTSARRAGAADGGDLPDPFGAHDAERALPAWQERGPRPLDGQSAPRAGIDETPDTMADDTTAPRLDSTATPDAPAPPSLSLGVEGGASLSVTQPLLGGGGAVVLSYGGWGFGLEGWATSVSVRQGVLRAAGGQLRFSKMFDLWNPRPWRFVAGPAVAAGIAWAGGQPAPEVVANTQLAPTAAVGAEAGVHLAASSHLDFTLHLDVRWNFGVTGTVDGIDTLIWSGPAVGFGLGARWSFT